jgi:hypothetical protein
MFRHVSTRVAGLIILVAGVWGGLIPFIGPYWQFTLGPDHAWAWSNERLYLDVLPGAAAALGGLILLGAGPRLSGRFGALLALAGGAWFAVGPDVSRLWHSGGAQGVAHGRGWVRMLEYLTFHSGLGVLIVAFAAFALPGAVARRRRVVEAEAAAGTAEAAPAAAPRRREPVAAGDGNGVATRDEAAVAREDAATREGTSTTTR